MARKDEARRSGSGVVNGTGRERDEWFGLLDDWGAREKAFRPTADWLESEHGLSGWWAQKLVVEYQQARGVRAPGIRPDGTFTVTASKSVRAPVRELERAFSDAEVRTRWLPGVALRERTAQPGRSARFDVEGDGTRLNVSFGTTGADATQVAIEHEKLPDAVAAEHARALWRDRLGALKTLLEG